MIVKNIEGTEYVLTKDEVEFLRAIKKLEKLNQGRLNLFGSGHLSVRIDGMSYYREIHNTSIICEGGDGGDNFD